MDSQERKHRKMRLGAWVFGGLILLDVAEYVVGVRMRSGALAPMALLAAPSVWLIARYYMHIDQIRERGER